MEHPITEQVMALNRSLISGTLDALKLGLDGAEQLASHQFATSWALAREGLACTSALVEVTNSESLVKWNEVAMQPLVDRLIAASRRQFELSVKVPKDLASATEARFGDYARNLLNAMEAATRGVPAGSESLIAAMKSAMQAGTAAFENMTRMTRQMSDMAEANVFAINDAAAKTLKAPTAGGKRRAA